MPVEGGEGDMRFLALLFWVVELKVSSVGALCSAAEEVQFYAATCTSVPSTAALPLAGLRLTLVETSGPSGAQ